MAEGPSEWPEKQSSGPTSRLERLKTWPRTTKLLAATAVVLAIALIVSLMALGSWRGYGRTWQSRAEDRDREIAQLQEEVDDLRDELTDAEDRADDAEASLASLSNLEDELAERQDALDERAEQLDAVEEAEEQREEAESDDLTVGSTIAFNDWEVTLVDVETHGAIDSSSPRGKYVVLLLDVTNNASHEREFLGTGRGFNILDVENDREFTFDSDASLEYYQTFDTNAWYLEDLGPGLSGRVPVAIDVSEDMSWGLAAMVTDGDVSDPWFVDGL